MLEVCLLAVLVFSAIAAFVFWVISHLAGMDPMKKGMITVASFLLSVFIFRSAVSASLYERQVELLEDYPTEEVTAEEVTAWNLRISEEQKTCSSPLAGFFLNEDMMWKILDLKLLEV